MAGIIDPAIAQATGSLVGPAIAGGKGIFNCLKHKYGYVRNMSKNFADLEKEEEYLCNEEDDVMTELENNKLKMQKTNRCKTWLNEVGKLKGEINDLKTKYNSISKSFCGLCPLPGLMKLGKRILEMHAKVVSLKNQIGQINIMLEKPPAGPVQVIKKHAKKTEEFPSLNKHVEMLQEYLRDVKLKRICIWGPPGVGKTTIMANLYNAVVYSPEFDIIFWVNVNTNSDVREIQEVLLKRLELKPEGDDQIAHTISEELKNKKYVLFFDEVSSDINWEEVGIQEQHSDGKVVFACRCRYICSQADEHINVQRLSDEDAWKMFQETVHLDLKNYRDIEPVARKIVNECGGMPRLIMLIGTRLKKVEVAAIWRNTLSQLRSPSMETKKELEEFYKSFKLVCDELAPNKRCCLLSWAIFPAGYEPHRDYIIECWRAEECFKHWSKLGEARDEGHAILNEFVDQSLLENGRKVAHYKMFEHFQRVALRIANQDEKSYRIPVKEGEKIREEEWEPANRISLVRLKEKLELPERPKCGKILTLLLQESSLVEFPNSFFMDMCNLRLLDLHDTEIKLLPSSISSLIKLTVLFLNNCTKLMQLPTEVGDLCSLEVLDIRHTGILALPDEIGQLTRLKCLRFSFVEHAGNHNQVEARPRDIISSNIIARLVSLEELIIDLNPNNGRWNRTLKDIAVEVASLENLTCLGFNFPDVGCFQNFINTSKSLNGNKQQLEVNNLRSFSIVIGYHQPCTEYDFSGCSAEKHLRFSAGDGFPHAILKMLEEACAFELIGHPAENLSDFGADKLGGLEACIIEECNEMKSIINENHAGDAAFQRLKKLHINNLPKLVYIWKGSAGSFPVLETLTLKGCNEMISIIDGNHTGDAAFQRLKELHINNLPKLEHIWKGSIQAGSFTVLTTLTLKGCHSLKTLFSQEIVLQLKQLQFLEVEDCKDLEKIIEDGSVVEPEVLPKLKKLELCSLPRLSNICQNLSLEWPSLETTIIKTCEELKNFPSTFEKAAKLGVIRCTQDWWNQLVWPPNDNVKNRFQSFRQLIAI